MTSKKCFWKNYIATWETSGISQAEYCRKHGLSYKSFGYNKRKAINCLSIVVADYLDLDLFSDNFFVFCNRNRTIDKFFTGIAMVSICGKNDLKSINFRGLNPKEKCLNSVIRNYAGFLMALIQC